MIESCSAKKLIFEGRYFYIIFAQLISCPTASLAASEILYHHWSYEMFYLFS